VSIVFFYVLFVFEMYTVLLPPGVNTVAVKYTISYNMIIIITYI